MLSQLPGQAMQIAFLEKLQWLQESMPDQIMIPLNDPFSM
jgi:hypothetical protein